ncbi:hypothetical protein NKJ72_29760 [Mesorhizobium sp. M0045]|uniref:hypothetical protein n=1 Tax=Mesorhizobium sp. M0045 TaxID=2956857 RepID=UPI00333CE2B3
MGNAFCAKMHWLLKRGPHADVVCNVVCLLMCACLSWIRKASASSIHGVAGAFKTGLANLARQPNGGEIGIGGDAFMDVSIGADALALCG